MTRLNMVFIDFLVDKRRFSIERVGTVINDNKVTIGVKTSTSIVLRSIDYETICGELHEHEEIKDVIRDSYDDCVSLNNNRVLLRAGT